MSIAMLDRRQLLTRTVGGLLGSLMLSRRSAAQAAGITALNDRLSLVASGGTNVLALSTADGLVVVDSGAPELGDRLIAVPAAAVARRSRRHAVQHPLARGEHRLKRRPPAGRGGDRRAREHPAVDGDSHWMPAEDRYRAPRPKSAHPTQTFHADGSMTAGNERIDYGYLIEAHTSGDIYVFFRDSNVLAVGDVASPARDPELDYFTGAWLGGRVDAMTRLLALATTRRGSCPATVR